MAAIIPHFLCVTVELKLKGTLWSLRAALAVLCSDVFISGSLFYLYCERAHAKNAGSIKHC